MIIKRTLSALTAFLIIISLAACSDAAQTDNNASTSDIQSEAMSPEAAEAAATSAISDREARRLVPDDLPDADFDGYTFRMLMFEDALSGHWTFDTDELTGEVINDDIYNRNTKLEDKYNFKFETEGVPWGSLASKAQASIRSGDHAYDLLGVHSFDGGSTLVLTGSLYNWYAVPNINFEKPWWHTQLNDTIELNGYLPYVSNDFSLNSYQYAQALVFNKDMAEAYGLGDLYALVDNREWVFDKFFEIVDSISRDTNGDGKMNNDDTYGYASNFSFHTYTWTYTAGEMGIIFDDDGNVKLNYTEKYFALLDKLAKLYRENNRTLQIPHDQPCPIAFDTNRVLFTTVWLYELEIRYRDVMSSYGILPYPMFDENMDTYHTNVDARGYILGIPIDAEDVSRTGLIIEAMAAESYKELIPDYLDVVLDKKYANDPDTSRMLDIIMDGRVWDVGYIYHLNNYSTFVEDYIGSGAKGDAVSSLAKLEKSTTKQFQKLADKCREMAEVDWGN